MSDFINILEKIESGEISADEGARLMLETKNKEEAHIPNIEISKDIEILDLIERGEISIEEGLDKFNVGKNLNTANTSPIDHANNSADSDQQPDQQTMPVSDKEMQKWQNWWTIPVFIGFSVAILSAYWMNAIYENSGNTFWFYFSWIPLFIGFSIMAFSWPSPNRTWVHVRVKQAHGNKPEKISISLPLPLKIISWAIGMAKRFAPEEQVAMIDAVAIDELLSGFSKSANKGTPFFVEVAEGENGERIEIYIG